MEEIWEVIKTVKYKAIINTEVSNKGNVRITAYYDNTLLAKYNLELGKGLYVTYGDYPNIRIANCSGDIYRYVYFMKHYNNEYIKGYQIHHIDYNHCNNSIDNLLYCSAIEHGKYHSFIYQYQNILNYSNAKPLTDIQLQQLDQYYKVLDYYKYLIDNKDNFSIDKAKQYLKQIRLDIINKVKQYKEQQKQNKKEQERIDRLNSGNYIEVDGRLVRIMSDYQKQRMAEGRRRNCYNNQEWRDKCRNGLLKHIAEHGGHYENSKRQSS